MGKVVKYIGRVVLAIILLPILLVFLLYLPPVQRFITDKAIDYLMTKQAMKVEIGLFKLGFPLDLKMENVVVLQPSADTLLALGNFHLDVGLRQIFRGQLSVDELTAGRVTFKMADSLSGLLLDVSVDSLDLKVHKALLSAKLVEGGGLYLEGGHVKLAIGQDSVKNDTVQSSFDWKFLLDKIELKQVEYEMRIPAMSLFKAGIADGKITGGQVDVGLQTVKVDSVTLTGAWCEMELQKSGGVTDTLPDANVQADPVKQQAWVVDAGSVSLTNSAFNMLENGNRKAELFLSGIAIRVDSVYNRGTVVRGRLRDLKAVQKAGITLTGMNGEVVLDTNETALRGARLTTLNSRLNLDVHTDTSVNGLMRSVPLFVTLNGYVGLADILPFYPELPTAIRRKQVNVKTALSMSDEQIAVERLALDMPGHFRVSGSGTLSAYRRLTQMAGKMELQGEFPDVTFAHSYLKTTGVEIPRQTNMQLRLGAAKGNFDAMLRLCCGEGCLTLDGTYRMNSQSYDGELSMNRFPLGKFIPADSLGDLSADIRVDGQAFSWKEAKAKAEVHIRSFGYRGYEYRDIVLQSSLNRTHFSGSLICGDSLLPCQLSFKGDSVKNDYAFELNGRIDVVNMYKLGLTSMPFMIGSDIAIRATMGADETYAFRLQLDQMDMADASRKYKPRGLLLEMNSNLKQTLLDLNSGDLGLNFHCDTSLMTFVGEVGKVVPVISRQVEKRVVDMEQISQAISPFGLRISGGRENAVSGFLNSLGIGFNSIQMDLNSREKSGIRFGVTANMPYLGSVRIDSITMGAWQSGKSLMYSLTTATSSTDWQELFNISMTGRMQGNRFRMEMKQTDEEKKLGVDLGINLVSTDTNFVFSIFPMNPILGYSRWMVNADNHVILDSRGKMLADLRLAYQDKLVSIRSLEDKGDMTGRLQVELQGIDLGSFSQLMPFVPQFSGQLNTDLLLYSRDSVVGVDGNIRIKDLVYEKQPVGTVELDLQYAGENGFSDHSVRFELMIDSLKRAAAEGTFATSPDRRDLRMDVSLPGLPLYVANAFIPEGLMKLQGEVNGGLTFRGTIDAPEVNGKLAFRNATAELMMLGTTFRLDTNELSVKNGRVLFRKFRFLAPNNSNMTVDGQIMLTPFDRMGLDLAVNADNFEVINVKKNQTSLVYGKAYANIRSRIAGPFSELSVTGNVNLLNRTAITYTLRTTDPALVDKSADLVRFVSFSDTTLNERDNLTNRVTTGDFSLRMLVEIGDQVSVGVNLSEDGSDHVLIRGGGNLVLAMNAENGMTLSGKYIVSGGSVVYNVPLAGKKEFAIQSGSYVEWTGNVAAPLLNISAAESVKATVEEGDRNRLVTFESIIRIQNTLTRPNISFDLSAPNDMVIQNQLATFSQEERTKQALNLLIYNSYTAPGAAKNAQGGQVANNALYSFVENELNKYTSKAGITLGVDSYNTDENTIRTDYTYQFSKQLFNDRIKVRIGGRISTDNNEAQSGGFQDNLVDDISIEYMLTKKNNLYVKAFRHSNYESVLDGEVVQTGVGIVWRKNFRKLKDLFMNNKRKNEVVDTQKQE